MSQTAPSAAVAPDPEWLRRALEADAPPPAYHAVPLWRFALFSVITGGLYTVYWLYASWIDIEQRERASRWPILKAVFPIVSAGLLVADLERQGAFRSAWAKATCWASAVSYVFALYLVNVPRWGALVLPFGSWLLLPILGAMRARTSPAALAEIDRPKRRHALLFLLGVPVWYVLLTFMHVLPAEPPMEPPPWVAR